MNPITMSAHARTRLQQRGIPRQVLPLLMEFGERAHDHRGAQVVYLNRAGKARVRQSADAQSLRRLDTALNIYAVIDCGGAIITVGHRTRRVNRQ